MNRLLRCVPKVSERSFQERISIFSQKNKPEKCAFFRIFCPNHERICKNAFVTEIVFFHFYALEYEKKVHFFHFFLACFSRSPRYIAKKDRKKWQMTRPKCRKIGHTGVILFLNFFQHTGVISKNCRKKNKKMRFLVLFSIFFRHTGVKSHLPFFSIFFCDIPG